MYSQDNHYNYKSGGPIQWLFFNKIFLMVKYENVNAGQKELIRYKTITRQILDGQPFNLFDIMQSNER